MLKSLSAIAAAILTTVAVVAPAQADGTWYGKRPNGVSLNGAEMNGKLLNGRFSNGHAINGQRFNGSAPAASSIVLDGIELPAATR